MMIFDEVSDFLFPSSGWARKNRNSLAQFMRKRTRVVWPASNGTFKRTRAERIKDTGKVSPAVKWLYKGGKSYRRAKLAMRRAMREKMK